jgi:hypothetical protein
MLSFDLIACAVFFLMAKSAGTVVGARFAPAQETLTQLMISGAAATGVRGLRMPAFFKRVRGAVRAPEPTVAPEVERETLNQYIERAIQQSCYSESQLWIMEKVVPHVLDQHGIDDFLCEVQHYLEGHDGPDATTDAKWIEKLIKSTESDSRKVASVCSRMLARNGFNYLERVIARRPEHADEPIGTAPVDLPGRHPEASPKPFLPRPDPTALLNKTGKQAGQEDER